MDLNKICVKTRVRSAWQAIDLGIRLAKLWWWPLFLCWSIIPFAMFAVFNIFLPSNPYIAFIVVWWFKPFYDRLPLFYASRALFSETISIKQIYKSALKIFKTDCIPWLLWRRFSYQRSYVLPVTVLEQLRGSARSKRLASLQGDLSSAPTWLTIVFVHLEQILPIGFLAVIMMFIPEWQSVALEDLYEWYEDSLLGVWLWSWGVLLGMCVLAPFYCIAGFMCYINRRVVLEGWDIELRFRSMAERLNPQKKLDGLKTSLVSVALISVISFCSLNSAPIFAESENDLALEESTDQIVTEGVDSETRQQILTILNGEHFVNKKIQKVWQLKNKDGETANDEKGWFQRFIEWLLDRTVSEESEKKTDQNFIAFLTFLFKLIFFGVLAAIAGILIYRYRHLFARLGFIRLASDDDQEFEAPSYLFGMQVTPESLPDDVVAHALGLLDEKRYRDAFGLIYRASLSYLVNQKKLRLHKAQTELECSRTVNKSMPASQIAEYFTQLTKLWVQLAYAHRIPAHDQAVLVCQRWNQIFIVIDDNEHRDDDNNDDGLSTDGLSSDGLNNDVTDTVGASR